MTHPNSFNTQPPEGGWACGIAAAVDFMRFNTQPPEGGWSQHSHDVFPFLCFNTQPPEGGWLRPSSSCCIPQRFQHTAARRRLEKGLFAYRAIKDVSTHSRPKAAGLQAV